MTDVRQDVADLLRAGATYAQIKRRLRVTNRTIAATRRHLGLRPTRGILAHRLTPQEHAELIKRVGELLLAGATYAQITSELGITAPTILRIRRHLGLPLAPRQSRARADDAPDRTVTRQP
ncbi:hypothetical protein ACFOOM_07695 [Streptomyces echinoruber]|uniref:Uncharacterized protein n=1 Tax=Streptomyces echinoruber TaxID=68898 RepID=A0A918R3J1_9ACTN|nr:hypothetical protein [Streptomyces echinoruber]GGZ80400.1 hypothetical protein GCM10010389_17780 [Streptomyces echinoruber]